jgi:hypothetical protein
MGLLTAAVHKDTVSPRRKDGISTAEIIQSVRWLCVNTSGNYFWHHSQEMSYEHGSDSRRLRSYGYLKFRMILPQDHSSFFEYRNFSAVVSLTSLLCIHIPCFSCSPIYGNLVQWDPVTVLASSANHHGQSIDKGTAHLHTPPRVCWNLVTHYAGIVLYVFSNHLQLLFIAPWPLRIRPMFIWHFWLGTTSGIRSWSIDIKSQDTLYKVG